MHPVERRPGMGHGGSAGPCIVEEYGSTVVVPAGWTCTADPHRNLILTKTAEAPS